MVDSVAVFPPGYRLLDANGDAISGAAISFFNAGTTTPKEVFADKDLQVSIGTTILTDSAGSPTSNGNAKTDVYVGTAPYKIAIADENGVVIETKDNRSGAVVSADSVDIDVIARFPVVTKSLDYGVVAADQNTTFAVNCSSGSVILTLPSAVSVGAGWGIRVQHAGSANVARIAVASGSGQTIAEGSKNFGGAFALGLNGEDCFIASDGGNWRITSHTPPLVKLAQGIIPVVSSSVGAPGSPVVGGIYRSGSATTWGGVSVLNGDLVQWSGTTWVPVTPYTDCGWITYTANENLYYRWVDTGWISEVGSTSQPGTFKASSQAAQEAASANDTAVTPGTQKWHPGHPKAWAFIASDGSVVASYGISGCSRIATGNYQITFSTAFTSANYAVVASSATVNVCAAVTSAGLSTTAALITTTFVTSGAAQNSGLYFASYGDQ